MASSWEEKEETSKLTQPCGRHPGCCPSLPRPDLPLFCSVLQIYKSTKCNDMQQSGSCPRGPFCAFAHVERTLFPLPWGRACSPAPLPCCLSASSGPCPQWEFHSPAAPPHLSGAGWKPGASRVVRGQGLCPWWRAQSPRQSPGHCASPVADTTDGTRPSALLGAELSRRSLMQPPESSQVFK